MFLRLRTAQTRRTPNPEPLLDPLSSVTVDVVTAAADRFSGKEVVSFATGLNLKRLTPSDRLALTRRRRQPPTRFTLSRASKCGLSSLVTALKTDAPTHIHSDVAEAPHARRLAVAPESATATHGMPYTVDLETAKSVERNVRISEGIPATVGPTDGRQKSSHTSPNDWQNARITL